MNRAYGLLEVKAFDDDARVIEGIATTPTPDRLGDIVEPMGAQYQLPIPLLWQHRSDQPVGEVFAAKPTKSGISVKVKMFKARESESLRSRLEEAWESVKIKLVKGFSIGFNPLEVAQIENTYSYRFITWEWLELSLVTIPANAEASIQTVKSLDTQARAAAGRRPGVVTLDNHFIRRVCRQHNEGVVYLTAAPTGGRRETRRTDSSL